MNKKVFKVLRYERLRRGIQLSKMAEEIGVTYQTLYNFECGKSNNLTVFIKYLKILDVTYDYIVKKGIELYEN
ncbi:MAG: helix-turn-helix transcriptional regulator [Methanobrevibacter sp.]|nr:helix-turn-helix transcriptional regulator [Methanobrevibacter sp.]